MVFKIRTFFFNVPVLIFTGQNDDIASSSEYGYMHYANTPSNTEKLYFEIENGGHGAANAPDMAGGEIGVYALSWLKTYLLDDPCYCDFLLDIPSNSSAYETNVDCESLELRSPYVEEMILLHPNPASGSILLNLGDKGLTKYEVYNAMGEMRKKRLCITTTKYNKLRGSKMELTH